MQVPIIGYQASSIVSQTLVYFQQICLFLADKSVLVDKHTSRHLKLLIRLNHQCLVPRTLRTDISYHVLDRMPILPIVNLKSETPHTLHNLLS